MIKIAVVTGASAGIGKALTKQLIENGVIVYAVARKESELTELRDAYPDFVRPVCANLSTKEGIEQVIDSVRGVSVDYFVNNAAVLHLDTLEQMSFEAYQYTFAVNVTAPALLIGKLSFGHSARVINVSSLAASDPLSGIAAYGMSKAALNSLTLSAEKELHVSKNVLTISFIPGEVDTGMQVQLQNYQPLSAQFQQAKRDGDLLEPEMSAQCMSWLLLSASQEQFLSADTLYNPEHQKFWLKPDQIIPEPKSRSSKVVADKAYFEKQTKPNFPPAHILMPVYNSAAFVVDTLNSVFMQNYENIRLILINDGSTDNTMTIILSYLSAHPEHREKIEIRHNEKNEGTAFTRIALWKLSKELDPKAYIFWLDSDDCYTEKDVIKSLIHQMIVTKSDICVFNFSVTYEDSSQVANAVGLLRDREKSQEILRSIYSSDGGCISPLDDAIDVLQLSALGWIKCYAPNVDMPESANYPFEDFVAMSTLIQANKITAINPERELIQYLRRSTSICGQRKPENFTLHIPAQLQRFFEAVLLLTSEDENQMRKLQMAKAFVDYKSEQYTGTLSTLVHSGTRSDMNEQVLDDYQQAIEAVKIFMSDSISEAERKISVFQKKI